MKVFISWSGTRSRAVAEALRDWLPYVINAVEPWMSEADIEKGTRWGLGIARELEESRVGLICLTPENLNEAWVLFEAGSLSKTLEDTYVCPYLFDVEPADLKGPLAQFQATRATEEDTRKLVQTVNRALGDDALSEERVNKAFEVWWPLLDEALESIPAAKLKTEIRRSDREILEEILLSVRAPGQRPIPALHLFMEIILKEQITDMLDQLTEREREVLEKRFGLKDGRTRSLEEVGESLGVTRERVRHIEAMALRKLRPPPRR